MKRLIIFRHGKSNWNADYDRDHDRPLAPRGVKASKLMGEWLRDTKQIPDFCLVSSALRTRQTYNYASEAGKWAPEYLVKEELYASTVHDYIAAIRQVSEEVETLVVVGHEPTCSMTTSTLSGGGADIRFPTATMARIDLDVDSWDEVEQGAGQLIWLQPPRMLPKKK